MTARVLNLLTTAVLLMITVSLPSLADSSFVGRWYRVEVIIFSHLGQNGLTSESWPLTQPTLQDYTTLQTLFPPQSLAQTNQAQNQPQVYALDGNAIAANTSTPVSGPQAFTLLPQNQLTLNREQTRINSRPGYQTILHIAWLQPVASPKQAKSIHIFGGNMYSANGQSVGTDFDGTQPYSKQVIWQINGSMRISVQRFFNVSFNLLFAAPTSLLTRLANNNYFTQSGSALSYFRLLQSRRMRSNELNYIGHPLYGALIMITPVLTQNTPQSAPNSH